MANVILKIDSFIKKTTNVWCSVTVLVAIKRVGTQDVDINNDDITIFARTRELGRASLI